MGATQPTLMGCGSSTQPDLSNTAPTSASAPAPSSASEPEAPGAETSLPAPANASAPVEPASALPPPEQIEGPLLQEYFGSLFKVADLNGDGVLDHAELIRLLCMSGFELRYGDILSLAATADTDHNNTIDYKEFVSTMSQSQALGKLSQKEPDERARLTHDEVEAHLKSSLPECGAVEMTKSEQCCYRREDYTG